VKNNIEKLPTDLPSSTIAIRPGWRHSGSVAKKLGEPDYWAGIEFGRIGWYRQERVLEVEARPDFKVGSGRKRNSRLKPVPGYTLEQWIEMSPRERALARYQYQIAKKATNERKRNPLPCGSDETEGL
jgi:hypothetical protein